MKNIAFTKTELEILIDSNNMLTSNVINFYTTILEKKCDSAKKAKCYFMNTFFYNTLVMNHSMFNYWEVEPWTRNVNIFDYHKLIIPVHVPGHWVLAVINFRDKRIEYYDSLGGSGYYILQHLKLYVILESWVHHGQDFNINDLKLEAINAPRQYGSIDCGVFVCKFAECACLDKPMEFSQSQMPKIRSEIADEIIQTAVPDQKKQGSNEALENH